MVVEHLKFSVASSERFIAWRRKPCWWRIEIHKASSGLLGVGIKKPKAEKTLSSSQVPVKSPSLCFFFFLLAGNVLRGLSVKSSSVRAENKSL